MIISTHHLFLYQSRFIQCSRLHHHLFTFFMLCCLNHPLFSLLPPLILFQEELYRACFYDKTIHFVFKDLTPYRGYLTKSDDDTNASSPLHQDCVYSSSCQASLYHESPPRPRWLSHIRSLPLPNTTLRSPLPLQCRTPKTNMLLRRAQYNIAPLVAFSHFGFKMTPKNRPRRAPSTHNQPPNALKGRRSTVSIPYIYISTHTSQDAFNKQVGISKLIIFTASKPASPRNSHRMLLPIQDHFGGWDQPIVC